MEELKVLKEANNMMRERNKFINKNNSNKFENRWITNFENKKQKEKNEMTPTINKTKTYINQIGTKPKLIDNYADKIPKYNTEKNIYSSKFKHSANDTCLGPSKNFKVSKDSDLLPEKINLINSSLNFDIKKFINDLAELANTRSPTDLTKKLDIKPYCLKDCKLQFIIPTTEVESLKIESLSQKLENEGDIDFKPSDNNKETISFCLNNIYDQVIKKVKKKESKKITFEKKELENLNEYNPTQLLIEDSLKNIYDIAIQQHMKKKTNKEHTIEKKVTKNYLDELYTNICKPKQEKIRNDVDFLDLNKIKQTKFDIYERLDKMVAGTFKNLHENLLWIYLKTKFKVQE